MEHSKLPPSSAARRVACRGSRAMEEQYPGVDTPAAKEGHAAHWVALEVLHNRNILTGNLTPEGELITGEMLQGAILYRDHIDSLVDRENAQLAIESRVDISIISDACWGTCDFWCYQDGVLHVWDYKFGFINVEVVENWQLIEYAAGIIDSLIRDTRKELEINFHLVQPRCFTDSRIKSWKINLSELRDYFVKLSLVEQESLEDNAPRTPSSQCKFCTARHACPALQRAAIESVEQAHYSIAENLTPAQLGAELRILHSAAELLNARISGLEQEALERIKQGERVTYYTVQQGYGRERWKKSAEEILTISDLMNIDLRKSIELITPKQAVAKGLPRELVDEYSETPRGEFKLIPEAKIIKRSKRV